MRKLYVDCDQYSEVLSVLQICAAGKPLFSNLEFVRLWSLTRGSIPSIPLFLSPRTTSICIEFDTPPILKALVASTIAAFPMLCPNLQRISFWSLPRDPMIVAAVSGMFLAGNWNTLRYLNMNSPLTKEDYQVIFKLPNLCELLLDIEGDTSLPSVVLPNLTDLTIRYDHDHGWLQGFRGATLGKLDSISFSSESESVGDFFEAFKQVALTTSIPETLSTLKFYTFRPWNPSYRSLLPFTQLKELMVDFFCEGGCSSTINDDVITDIARAMPRLEALLFGYPCQTPTGITAKGLTALAYYCPRLSTLRVHFQVSSLDPQGIPGDTPGGGPTIPADCALTELDVGEIPLPIESVSVVALALLRIFPRIDDIDSCDGEWEKVMDAIRRSKQLVDL